MINGQFDRKTVIIANFFYFLSIWITEKNGNVNNIWNMAKIIHSY